jgi:chromosome segregation ATPase
MSNKQTFSIRDQQCVKVVVFTDRAEVQRLLKAKLKKGENEIVINSISNSIDRESVRVEGRGNASVLDVICQDKRVESDNLDNISKKEKELKNELNELEAKRDTTNYKLERVNKQINVLNEFANSLSKEPSVRTDRKDTPALSTGERVDGFLTFLDTYSNRLETLDLEKYKLEKELRKLDEQIQVIRDNLNQLSFSSYNQTV